MRDALEGLVQLCSPFFSDKRIYVFFNTRGFLLKLILFFNSILFFVRVSHQQKFQLPLLTFIKYGVIHFLGKHILKTAPLTFVCFLPPLFRRRFFSAM